MLAFRLAFSHEVFFFIKNTNYAFLLTMLFLQVIIHAFTPPVAACWRRLLTSSATSLGLRCCKSSTWQRCLGVGAHNPCLVCPCPWYISSVPANSHTQSHDILPPWKKSIVLDWTLSPIRLIFWGDTPIMRCKYLSDDTTTPPLKNQSSSLEHASPNDNDLWKSSNSPN